MTKPVPAQTARRVQLLLGHKKKKSKTSVSLSGELVDATDAIAGKAERSAFVERALRKYLRSLLRQSRNDHDLKAINASAEKANRQSDDLLELQSWPE